MVSNSPANWVDPSGQTAKAGGHHWIPNEIIEALGKFWETDAVKAAKSMTTHPGYIHRYDAWNGVKHSEYNAFVKDTLNKWQKSTGSKLTKENLEHFVKWIEGAGEPPFNAGAVFGKDFKGYCPRLKRARQWSRGFFASSLSFKSLKSAAAKAGLAVKDSELKILTRATHQFNSRSTTYAADVEGLITRKIKEGKLGDDAVKFLKRLENLEGYVPSRLKRLLKSRPKIRAGSLIKGLVILSVISDAAHGAENGHSGHTGAAGASLGVARGLVWAGAVEGGVIYAVDAAACGLPVHEPISTKSRIERAGGGDDFKEFLKRK